MHIRTGDPLVQPDPRGLRQRQDGAQQQLFPLRQVRQDILGRERRRGMLGGEAAEMIRETSGGSGRPQTRTRTRTCTRTRTHTYYAACHAHAMRVYHARTTVQAWWRVRS